MADAPDLLERTTAITNNTTPTGRELGVVMNREYGLFRIRYVDNKPGDLPNNLNGLYTKHEYAASALRNYIREMWDMNDKAVEKARLKSHREKVMPNAETPDQPRSTG